MVDVASPELSRVITTVHRKRIVDGVLAGFTTKQIARTLGTTAGNVSSVVHLMNEGSNSVRDGFIFDVVTSQSDPVAFLRQRRDPDAPYLVFPENGRELTYLHDRRRGFLSRPQLHAWYEYRDLRIYPEESAREARDPVAKWKVINARSRRLLETLLRPYEVSLIETYAFSRGMDEAGAQLGFAATTTHHRNTDLSKKMGIVAGNMTPVQQWLEMVCLGLITNLPSPAALIHYPFDME